MLLLFGGSGPALVTGRINHFSVAIAPHYIGLPTPITGGILQKNLVVNGNDWNGTGSVNPAGYGWSNSYAGGTINGNNATYTVNGTTIKCLQVNPNGTTGAGRYQDIPVIPGQTYTFCLLAFAANTGSAVAKLSILNTAQTVDFLTTIGTPVGALGTLYSAASTNINGRLTNARGQWQCLYGTFTVPNGYSTARVMLLNGGDNSSNVDFAGVQIIQGTRLQDYIDHEPNASYANSSSPLNGQGSLLNVAGTPVYSYSSTTTSITITIPASTYTYTDNNTTVSVSAYSNTFSGLAASTTYYFDIAYDVPSNAFVVNGPSSSQFTASQILTDCYRDGRMAIDANHAITTPSSGSGGGTGGGGGGGRGGSCPAAWQQLLTKEQGLLPADKLELGMHIPGPDGWVKILDLIKIRAPIWTYILEKDGLQESFDVNDTHACKLKDGGWIKVCDMIGGEILEGDITVVAAYYLKHDFYIAMEVEGHVYYMGDALVHNFITL